MNKHKSFKESLIDILDEYGELFSDGGTEDNEKYYIKYSEAILKLISEFAPTEITGWELEGTGELKESEEGYNAGIKAYKQALGVDE